MSLITFFALRDDLIDMLEFTESKGPLKYARTGNFLEEEFEDSFVVYHCGASIPDLGRAGGDQTARCDSFLVCERDTPINLRKLQDNSGRQRILIDQLVNPDSVTILPAGIWNDDVLISGNVSTASQSYASQSLMRRFRTSVKKTSFLSVKGKGVHVGPKALAFYESGKRLTAAIQSPREYDLVID